MRRLLLIPFVIALATIVVNGQEISNQLRKLSYAGMAISNLYVDKVDEGKLVEDAIKGMLSSLDPHSDYLTADEVKKMNEPLQGNFDGIGIQFNMLNDTLFVIQTIVGGPSERVGVMSGDRIIFVNDTLIAGVKMENTDIMKRLRGTKGTEVEIKILRRGVPDLITFKIIRDKIPIFSIDASYMADKKTGFIRLSRFGATTHEEMVKAINDLKAQGMQNLILDLQSNGGGYLTASIKLADEFLSDNRLIVYTEGNRAPREDALSTAGGIFQSGKLVVLIDEGSASASEILSGAVQDWDRGVIIGRRSFGKGLVQRPVNLPDASMIRLTIARYYTPTGRSIQKSYEEGRDAYDLDRITRYNRGELFSADSIHFPDSLKYKTLVNKREVFGGGGIMPDIFVPIDTSRFTVYHRDLVAKGVVNRFSMSYYDQHQQTLKKKYPKYEAYEQGFNITPEMMEEIIKMGEAEKIERNDDQLKKSADYISLQIKALIARDLFDMSEYYRVINHNDESYQKALEIINNDTKYNALLKGMKGEL